MTLSDIALEAYDDLGEPEDISIPAIVFWMESQIGKINSLINSCFSITDGIVSPELGIEEGAILKELYMVRFYEGEIRKNLGAAGTAVLEIVDGDSRIKLSSKTEIARYYDSQKKDAIKSLNSLIASYNTNQSGPRGINFGNC